MKCHYHADIDAAQTCRVCARPLCQSCAHTIKGRVYCQDCLVAGADLAGVARSSQLASYSPARAAVFALFPGLGAVYNQQYVKAVQHFSIFAALLLFAERKPSIFVLATIAFYIFTIIDAYRSAQSIMLRRISEPSESKDTQVNVPIWGGILVLVGVVLLLDNMRMLSLRAMIDYFWPLLFVIGGLFLVWDFYRRPSKSPSETPPAPPDTYARSARGEEE